MTPRHVFCAGMYRACSTWQYEVVCHLLDHHAPATLHRLGYLDGPDYRAWARRSASPGEWAALKSHDGHADFGRALRQGRALAVYAYRDLRDVVDSMGHKMGLPFEALMRQGLVHRILANDRFWTTRPHVIVQRYEDIMADPSRAVAELAGHLGLTIAWAEAEAIAREYSLEANRRRTEAMRVACTSTGVDLSRPENHQRYDPATLLHWNHLRQGATGGWRVAFEPSHRRLIDRLGGDWLIARGYESNHAWIGEDAESPEERRLARRSRLSCAIYFASRRYPKLTEPLRRRFGPKPLTASAHVSEPASRPAPA